DGARRVADPAGDLRPRPAAPAGGGAGRGPGAGHRSRPRRRGARRPHPHRDAVRPQSQRRLARAGRGGERRRLRGRSGRARRRAAGAGVLTGAAAEPPTGAARMTSYHAELAWVDGRPQADVAIGVEGDRFAFVTPGAPPPAGATRLPGLTLPGLADTHSHAFHRALRGRTHQGLGTFWAWRRRMYQVAQRLQPDTYLALATAVYAELALAGVTCVGEFHYLHHRGDGRPYADPNAMASALVEAAARAGVRLTLLDTCYLTADVDGSPPTGPQRRFADADVDAWARRVSALRPDPRHWRLGAAVHSVRAVPAAQIP